MHAVRHFRRCLVNDHQRQLHSNGRPVTDARAHRFDPSAVRLDQVTADRQAQAEPAVRAGERAVGLFESLKQMREEFWRDAFARVAHGDLDVRVHPLQRAPAHVRRGA